MNKLLQLCAKINLAVVKNVIILLILTRLVYLEESQLVLILEIIASIVMLTTKNNGE